MVGLQPRVERKAARREAREEVLAELGEDGLLIVLIHLIELETLSELGNAAVLLELGELGACPA